MACILAEVSGCVCWACARWLRWGFRPGEDCVRWPFIPTGDGQNRDNAEELELKAKLEHELPIEEDLSRWLGLFDAPI